MAGCSVFLGGTAESNAAVSDTPPLLVMGVVVYLMRIVPEEVFSSISTPPPRTCPRTRFRRIEPCVVRG